MKKVFFLGLIAASLAACNSESGSTTDVKDSILEKIDSTADARADSLKTATDSIAKKVESTFERTDSANKAIADSMDKKQ